MRDSGTRAARVQTPRQRLEWTSATQGKCGPEPHSRRTRARAAHPSHSPPHRCGATRRLHTDKCAALEPSGSAELRVVEAHPLVSSVLYLSDHGGPTAVFDQTLEQAGQCGARDDAPTGAVPRPDAAAQVLVCAPERGRLLLFDGRLLHAVLHRPGGVAHGLRRTLLVNWWADRPPGVADAPRDFSCACTDAATVASPRAHVPERAQRPTVVPLHAAARAAAPVERFFADVRDHWIAQRAPCEVAQAYASSERAGRAPILLALYDGGGDERDEGGVPAPAAAAPGVGPDARIAWVVARRGLALSTTDSATSARELRAIWPP